MAKATTSCIVLVEPDKAFASVLKTRLEQRGKQVRIVPTVSRLKTLLTKKDPEVIVLEASVGAVAAVKQLRTEARYRTIPILVSGTHTTRGELQEVTAAGANSFLLTTQLTPQQLVDSILNWCTP